MNVKTECTWLERKGRDSDGDAFRVLILLHGSGRVLARVRCPAANDEWRYGVLFDCKVPEEVLPGDCFDFVDEDSAMRFAEQVLSTFDPVDLSPRKAPAPRRRVKTTS